MGKLSRQQKMQYKLKNINIDLKSPKDKVEFPALKDRIIEKTGHKIHFTLNQVEENTRINLKNKKELTAKKELEEANMVNIEHFHPFVKELTDEQLSTAWLYHESKAMVGLCEKKLSEINKQIETDENEVVEIKKQIPELSEIISPYNDKTPTN